MTSSIRLLICGDRNWTNHEAIRRELLRIKPSVVIEGENGEYLKDEKGDFILLGGKKVLIRGVDLMAREEAEKLGITVLPFPANWSLGRKAGPIRNHQMLVEGLPTLVIAFHPDLAKSRGTADMVRQTRKAGVPLQVFTD